MVSGIRTTDKMMKIQLVVSLLVACAWASKTRCPIALGKYPFSDTKFAGNWYFIAGTPMDGTELCKCGKYTLDQQKNGEETFFQLKYTAVAPDGSDVSIEGHSKPYKTERSSLKLGVWKKEGSDTWNGVYKQSIVATDYDSYAVIVACRHIFDDKTKAFGRDLMAQVWSRNQTLTKDVQDVLVSFLSGYDVDPDSIKIVDRTNCA